MIWASMLIRLKVHAGAGKAELREKAADAYEVWVREPAENGRANRAALKALARALSLDAARLRLVKGATMPSKIVRVLGR